MTILIPIAIIVPFIYVISFRAAKINIKKWLSKLGNEPKWIHVIYVITPIVNTIASLILYMKSDKDKCRYPKHFFENQTYTGM